MGGGGSRDANIVVAEVTLAVSRKVTVVLAPLLCTEGAGEVFPRPFAPPSVPPWQGGKKEADGAGDEEKLGDRERVAGCGPWMVTRLTKRQR